MTLFCAYVHSKPNGDVFYVGKGTNARAHNLNPSQRNDWHAKIVNKYTSQNIGVGVIECSSEDIAFALEIGLIKCFKRMNAPLVNMTDGGQGQSGRKQSETERKKKSDILRGVPRTAEVCKKISIANTGKRHTEETKQKLSAIFKGRQLHPAFIQSHQSRAGKNNPNAKAVVGTHTISGTIRFSTVTEAAKFMGCPVSKLSTSMKTVRPYKGWTFQYL